MIDHHLRSFTPNITKKTNKISNLCYVKKLIIVLHTIKKQSITVMYGLYFSVAMYGIIAWGNANEIVLKLLLKSY